MKLIEVNYGDMTATFDDVNMIKILNFNYDRQYTYISSPVMIVCPKDKFFTKERKKHMTLAAVDISSKDAIALIDSYKKN